MKMMTRTKVWMLAILFISFFVVSCEKEEEEINEAKVLVEFLESTSSPYGKDYINTDAPAIKPAVEVRTANNAGAAYIIDVRSAEDYNAGHIVNAVNVPVGQVVSHVQSEGLGLDDEIYVVCYSGQSAGWATCLLRLMGYTNAWSMAFGMSSWNADLSGPWENNAYKNTYVTDFTTDVTEKGPKGDLPVLNTGMETGLEILEERVAAVQAEGFGDGAACITSQAVFDNLDNYYIINYWPEEYYLDPGHIPGAMQYDPGSSLQLSEDLETLPTDKTIVVYCYTGQNSASVAAYLRVLGYDAKSLLFGANNMIYDIMPRSKWNQDIIQDYELVTE
jgi:rhodanese-related sulfurtransferase